LVFARYRIKKSQRSKYVIDQLVPLSLGGTTDPSNLWPQLRTQANSKDGQENAARLLVCQGQVELAVAQSAFEKDWTSAQTMLQVAAQETAAKVGAYLKALDDARKAQEAAAAQAAAQQAAAEAAARQQAQQQLQQQASCPNGTYVNSAGNVVCSPYSSPSGPPAGATAQCRDGTYSFSQSRSGTCSSHGGVAQWL
jgi:hypothetical protein